MKIRELLCSLVIVFPGFLAAEPTGVPYDIVYSRAPRDGDFNFVELPEVLYPISIEPGVDLMLLRPDGTEEVLVSSDTDGDGDKEGAIVDPMVSFDAKWIYYVQFHDQTNLDYQRPGDPARAGSDIFKIHLETRQVVQLTNQEWTPNSGVVEWSSNHLAADENGPYYLGYGVFNLGPCPLPNGKVVFSSSRNNYFPNKTFTNPNFQLFVMDNDGSNVECTGHLNLGSALHPTVLTDGRVMFSSYEAQGLRDNRLWGLWAIWPDGRNWEPLLSAFTKQNAFHFQTQLSNGDIAVTDYYNQNNKGFGAVLAFPSVKDPALPPFGNPKESHPSNPDVRRGIWWFSEGHPSHKQPRYRNYSFSPPGLHALSAFTHSDDEASSRTLDGDWAGKVTHPAAAPNNDVLVAYSTGPANSLDRPTKYPAYDSGIAMVQGGIEIDDVANLVQIKNDPNYNEIQPRPVVTYEEIYGIAQPVELPWYQNDGSEHASLEPGTPFGLTGTSSFYKRDTEPATSSPGFEGSDAFNNNQNQKDSNWSWQGAVAGIYTNADIHAVRVLSMEPSSNVGRGPGIGTNWVKGFDNHANERLRILGEVLLRKTSGGSVVMDPEGNPDTSFLAKIPADTPFTFQTLDENGMVLNMSQTWHHVRPGEMRADCGGCHAHSQVGLDFDLTAAAKASYRPADMATQTPLLSKNAAGETIVVDHPEKAIDVEYYRDILPILQRSCVGCHSADNPDDPGNPAAQLDLTHTGGGNYDQSYKRLADDNGADGGYPPIISSGTWRNNNASRYIRKFQSRRSLLIWKIFGERLDGWTNDDFPTESVPGDPDTLPPGANPNDADIDFTGDMMPPPDSDPSLYPRLTEDEKMMIARWIDLGSPATSQGSGVQQDLGWFADELRPTLDISIPKAGRQVGPIDRIQIGMFDYYTDLDMSTFSVTCDKKIGNHPPGTELAPEFRSVGDHVWAMRVNPPIKVGRWRTLTVSVRDTTGNLVELKRKFSVGPNMTPTRITKRVFDFETGEFSFDVGAERMKPFIIQTSPNMQPGSWIERERILDFDGAQPVRGFGPGGEPACFYRIIPLSELSSNN